MEGHDGCAGLGVSVAYGGASEISRSMPGSVTINVVSIQQLADINGSGTIDGPDLTAVTTKLNSEPAPGAPEDINRDGEIDVLDVAIVARYFGQEVTT